VAAVGWSWRIRRVIPVLALILANAGCAGAPPAPTPTPAPTGVVATAAPNATAGPTTAGATPSAPPGLTAEPTQGQTGTPEPTAPAEGEPLPEPSLTEPADVAAALFDWTTVADGVVSLIDLMGVAVYDRGGTLLRPGADRGAGDLALTEGEVRGLIAMTRDDLPLQTEAGGPFPVADFYAALEPGLPPGYTIEQLVAAFNDAYAAEPQSLAAQMMRGQELAPERGLLRVQVWLLLIDGFSGPAEEARSSVVAAAQHRFVGPPAANQLPAGSSLGVANPNLPGLTSPTPGLTNAEWAELLRQLPTLAFRVPFDVVSQPGGLHEGHGGVGAQARFLAAVGVAAPLVSTSGKTLLPAAPQPGVAIRWESPNEPIWNAHGSFDQALGTPQLVDPGQLSGAAVTFTPKKEVANGVGTELLDYGDLTARADQVELVRHSYDVGVLGAALYLIRGSLAANGPTFYAIWWHQLGDGYLINITWTDVYNGIPDIITFRGLADHRDSGVQGVDAYYTGDGTATGSRPGWKSCNPGIDVVPSGSGEAVFQAGLQGDEVTFGAFPAIDNPLAGILAWPFTANADFETVEINQPAIPGALCPHSIQATGDIFPFGHP
jgi:hypothetical protein